MNYLKILKFAYHPQRRKIKTYIPKHYEAIPEFYKPIFIDIHDTYKLRSKQQIRAELQGKQFEFTFEYTDHRDDLEKFITDRKAVIIFDIRQFKMTELQMERYKILMGGRALKPPNQQRITCDMYPTFNENVQRAEMMLYEVIIEAKRAP